MDDLVHAAADAFLAASRQAREMLDSGDGAAERLLAHMVVAFPDRKWPVNELAWLLKSRGDWPAAVRIAAILRERFPDETSGYAVGAFCHRQAGAFAEAAAILDAAEQMFQGQPWIGHERASGAKAAEAAGLIDIALALAGGAGGEDSHRLRIGILFRQGRLVEARAGMAAADLLFPGAIWLLADRVQDAVAQKRWVEAVALAARLRERRPAAAAGYRFGLRALRALRRLDEAGALQLNAAAQFPDDSWPHEEAGRIAQDTRHAEREAVQAAFAQKRWVETIALAEGMRERQPEEATAYRFGIQALRALRRLDEADDLQRRAVARFPADIGLHAEAAKIAHDARDWEREEQLWSEMRRLFPADPLAYEHGAGALQACTRDDDAVALLDQAIAMFADNQTFYRKQARLAEYRMDWAGADDRWAEALRAFPDDREMRLQWATCRSRPPLLALRDLDATIGRLQACVAMLPDHLPYHLALIATLQATGRLAAAEQAVAHALTVFPDAVDAKLASAAVLAARGETARALDAGRAAIRLDPSSLTGIAAFARLLIDAAAHEEADAVCEAAIARYPAELALRRLFAESAASREAFQAAYDRWLAAAAIWPDDAGILRELGEARIRCRRWPRQQIRQRRRCPAWTGLRQAMSQRSRAASRAWAGPGRAANSAWCSGSSARSRWACCAGRRSCPSSSRPRSTSASVAWASRRRRSSIRSPA